MVLINALTHTYLEHRHTEVEFTTYVDNFELQSAEVASTTEVLHTLQNVCSLLDVQLDAKKTVRWSCAAEGSREIRQTRAATVTHAQDLGAHMQFDLVGPAARS